MAPIRRYLRITKYSVIECRIYLDNPALAQTWLLNPRKPVLPRVIESVRPLVLPKLREERERSRNKRSTKKKAIKDLVVEDDFEVSIFLTETTTRHSLVTKHKHFHDTTQTKLTSNSGRLVGATHEAPLDVDMHAASGAITILREESDDEDLQLDAVPLAPASVTGGAATAAAASNRPKRARRDTADAEADDGEQQQGGDSVFEVIPSSDEDGDDADNEGGPARSKMAMDISYEGFSIYGRVLCLVVKRRDQSNATGSGGGGAIGKGKQGGGTAMMENFIISTQVPAGAEAEAEATS
ncbi:uncharacterized protein PG986_003045 [Apiospora aurea]|uniref:Uncharacterized protein n=1 Tax=Apiospora aurea TaxID=335848 RepID=A0ABR1QQJ4_9PEZI